MNSVSNIRYDEWLEEARVLKLTDENIKLQPERQRIWEAGGELSAADETACDKFSLKLDQELAISGPKITETRAIYSL